MDVLENELDEMDPVKVHSGELFGEALLATCYSTSSNMFPRSSHDDSQITSAQSSKLNNPKLTKHRNTEIYDSSFHERLLSPRYYNEKFINIQRLDRTANRSGNLENLGNLEFHKIPANLKKSWIFLSQGKGP